MLVIAAASRDFWIRRLERLHINQAAARETVPGRQRLHRRIRLPSAKTIPRTVLRSTIRSVAADGLKVFVSRCMRCNMSASGQKLIVIPFGPSPFVTRQRTLQLICREWCGACGRAHILTVTLRFSPTFGSSPVNLALANSKAVTKLLAGPSHNSAVKGSIRNHERRARCKVPSICQPSARRRRGPFRGRLYVRNLP
jgi:hypothetical protein